MKKEDTLFEIRFFEGILTKDPEFIEALAALGDLYTKNGLYEKGLAIDLRLTELRPQDPTVLYNLACSYSLIKDLDNALGIMKKAICYGYNDFGYLEKDNDLVNLRADQRFQRYYKRVRKQSQPHAETYP